MSLARKVAKFTAFIRTTWLNRLATVAANYKVIKKSLHLKGSFFKLIHTFAQASIPFIFIIVKGIKRRTIPNNLLPAYPS